MSQGTLHGSYRMTFKQISNELKGLRSISYTLSDEDNPGWAAYVEAPLGGRINTEHYPPLYEIDNMFNARREREMFL